MKSNFVPLGQGKPRRFPACIPREPRVSFIWPEADPADDQKAVLEHLAQNLTYLGRSHSRVLAWLDEAPPEPSWIPLPEGRVLAPGASPAFLRVPYPGRLEVLDDRFDHGLDPTLDPHLVPYGHVQDLQPIDPARLRSTLAAAVSGRAGPAEPQSEGSPANNG